MTRSKVMVLTITFVILITSSCQTSRTSRVSQIQTQLVQYSLKKTDLPDSGWSVEGKGWGSDFGGESYGITYIRDKHVFVNHIVSIHSSEDRAQQAYEEWETDTFDITNLQPEQSYTPLDQDDDYRSECVQMKPTDPLIVCFYLQRHNKIISYVRISLDSRSTSTLTFEEINDILFALDKRVSKTD